MDDPFAGLDIPDSAPDNLQSEKKSGEENAHKPALEDAGSNGNGTSNGYSHSNNIPIPSSNPTFSSSTSGSNGSSSSGSMSSGTNSNGNGSGSSSGSSGVALSSGNDNQHSVNSVSYSATGSNGILGTSAGPTSAGINPLSPRSFGSMDDLGFDHSDIKADADAFGDAMELGQRSRVNSGFGKGSTWTARSLANAATQIRDAMGAMEGARPGSGAPAAGVGAGAPAATLRPSSTQSSSGSGSGSGVGSSFPTRDPASYGATLPHPHPSSSSSASSSAHGEELSFSRRSSMDAIGSSDDAEAVRVFYKKKFEMYQERFMKEKAADVARLKEAYTAADKKKKEAFTQMQSKAVKAAAASHKLLEQRTQLLAKIQEMSTKQEEDAKLIRELQQKGGSEPQDGGKRPKELAQEKSTLQVELSTEREKNKSLAEQLAKLQGELKEKSEEIAKAADLERKTQSVEVTVEMPSKLPQNGETLKVRSTENVDNYQIQWYRSFRGSLFNPITGTLATQAAYVPTADDIGAVLKVELFQNEACGGDGKVVVGSVEVGPIRATSELVGLVDSYLKKKEVIIQVDNGPGPDGKPRSAKEEKKYLLLNKEKIKIKHGKKTVAKELFNANLKIFSEGNNPNSLTLQVNEKPQSAFNFSFGSAGERDSCIMAVRVINSYMLKGKPVESLLALRYFMRALNEGTTAHLSNETVLQRKKSISISGMRSHSTVGHDATSKTAGDGHDPPSPRPNSTGVGALASGSGTGGTTAGGDEVDADGFIIPKNRGFDKVKTADGSDSDNEPEKPAIQFEIKERPIEMPRQYTGISLVAPPQSKSKHGTLTLEKEKKKKKKKDEDEDGKKPTTSNIDDFDDHGFTAPDDFQGQDGFNQNKEDDMRALVRPLDPGAFGVEVVVCETLHVKIVKGEFVEYSVRGEINFNFQPLPQQDSVMYFTMENTDLLRKVSTDKQWVVTPSQGLYGVRVGAGQGSVCAIKYKAECPVEEAKTKSPLTGKVKWNCSTTETTIDVDWATPLPNEMTMSGLKFLIGVGPEGVVEKCAFARPPCMWNPKNQKLMWKVEQGTSGQLHAKLATKSAVEQSPVTVAFVASGPKHALSGLRVVSKDGKAGPERVYPLQRVVYTLKSGLFTIE